jgi:hypothetical protein
MAQRTPTSPGNRDAKSAAPAKTAAAAKKAPAAAKSGPARPGAGKPGGTGPRGPRPALPRSAAAKRPPKLGRSIVQQGQRPWGLIITAIVIVILAVGVIGYAVLHKPPASYVTGSYTNPEIPDAKAISGMIYKKEPDHTHVEGIIKYDASPPVGGNHSQYWADCSGTVYPNAIANENAVHMLEHGAVWITYNPATLSKSDLTALKGFVTGQDRIALSPYAGLKTPISLQAWGYQLFVNKASDSRIADFISTLKFNQATTPENASCSDPAFDASKSTLGHPQD